MKGQPEPGHRPEKRESPRRSSRWGPEVAANRRQGGGEHRPEEKVVQPGEGGHPAEKVEFDQLMVGERDVHQQTVKRGQQHIGPEQEPSRQE